MCCIFVLKKPRLFTDNGKTRGHPRTELAFLISLSSHFLSAVDMLLFQHTTPQKMADATTESEKVFSSIPYTPKDLSLLSR